MFHAGYVAAAYESQVGTGRVRLQQPDFLRQRPHNLHETCQLPRVQLITPDNVHSRCPKHVEFRDKIKFWILDEFVGYLYEDTAYISTLKTAVTTYQTTMLIIHKKLLYILTGMNTYNRYYVMSLMFIYAETSYRKLLGL
jgi:hypothetical protein